MDGQIGLEPTPEAFIAKMVAVFGEVRRVLRDDGTLWLNLGDSYNGVGGQGGQNGGPIGPTAALGGVSGKRVRGLKPKDLCMMPWRVALALQQPHEVSPIVRLPEDRAWLAAMIDGEGCIGIRRQESSGSSGLPSQDSFIPYLSVGNNDRELLDQCVRITGKGTVRLKSRCGDGAERGIVSRRDHWTWRLDGDAAVDVVRACYQYLIAKRRQAICIYTLDQSNKNTRELRGRGPVPPDEMERRRALWALVKACNQRQPVDMPTWTIEPRPKVEPGWWIRSVICWHKKSPMPESVTDRPTSSWEPIFLMSKAATYFYDAEAVRLPPSGISGGTVFGGFKKGAALRDQGIRVAGREFTEDDRDRYMTMGANQRNVWTLGPEPYSEAHFATFPTEIPRRAIKAGTSEKGCCPTCGAPWRRVVERFATGEKQKAADGWDTAEGAHGTIHRNGRSKGETGKDVMGSRTVGWKRTCEHDGEPVPCIVLDPFLGSGTTVAVARELGRHGIGIELNPAYAKLARRRIGKAERPNTFRDMDHETPAPLFGV